MLIDITIKNYLSFKDEIRFSLEASAGNEMKDNFYELPKNKILKSAIIYGHNGGGKTNLLRAVDLVAKLIVEGYRLGPNEPILGFPNCRLEPFQFSIDERISPSEFQVRFLLNEIEYRYKFSLDKTKIISEELYAKKTQKERKLYIRNLQDIVLYDFDANNSTNRVRENTLALPIFANENSQEAKLIHNFFRNIHVFYTNSVTGTDTFEMLKRDLNELDESKKFKTFLNKALDTADLGVEGFEYSITKESIENLPQELKSIILPQISPLMPLEIEKMDFKFKHSVYDNSNNKIGVDYFPQDKESDGTNKFLNLSGSIFNVIKEGKILFIDEIEANLHPVLQERIIKIFHEAKSDKNFQVIYTTHNTKLMDVQDIFRRDQIWFTEKNNMGHSIVYNLLDQNEKVRKDTVVEKNYYRGLYGGISKLEK